MANKSALDFIFIHIQNVILLHISFSDLNITRINIQKKNNFFLTLKTECFIHMRPLIYKKKLHPFSIGLMIKHKPQNTGTS